MDRPANQSHSLRSLYPTVLTIHLIACLLGSDDQSPGNLKKQDKRQLYLHQIIRGYRSRQQVYLKYPMHINLDTCPSREENMPCIEEILRFHIPEIVDYAYHRAVIV